MFNSLFPARLMKGAVQAHYSASTNLTGLKLKHFKISIPSCTLPGFHGNIWYRSQQQESSNFSYKNILDEMIRQDASDCRQLAMLYDAFELNSVDLPRTVTRNYLTNL